MEAKDLMIGDWVNIYAFPNESPKEKDLLPAKISSIMTPLPGEELEEHIECCYSVDEEICCAGRLINTCLPIPITPEILEKNGFKIVHSFGHSESYRWGYHKGLRDYASVDVTFYDEPIGGVSRLVKMETASKKDDGINSIHSCDIEFIHQLQHALRLCGIEKEIVL